MISTKSPPPATSYPLSFQSTAASLSSFFARRPLFSIACSLFSQNTRVGGTSTLPRQAALPKRAHFAKGCKNTETATLTTFRINTCKSVSKQRTLTIFRINTCEKQGGGGVRALGTRPLRPPLVPSSSGTRYAPGLKCQGSPRPHKSTPFRGRPRLLAWSQACRSTPRCV